MKLSQTNLLSGFDFTEKNNFYVVPRSLGCDVTMKKLTGRAKKKPDSKNEIRFILCSYAPGGEGGI